MHKNSSDLVKDVFKSKGFLIQFIIILKTIREFRELRKQFPAQMQEWNTKQRQMLHFKTKLLHFLERQFGRKWVRTFVEKAMLQLGIEEKNRKSEEDNEFEN